MTKVKGRVRKFGNNIDTDTITPARTVYFPVEELKKYAFEPIFPEFYKTIQKGDIIVGGNNFGCGSSREQATSVIKEFGIDFIVCDSMARIYYRNCIAWGVYPVLSKGAGNLFHEGDEIEIDFEHGELKNLKSGEKGSFNPLSGTPLQILNEGGIFPLLKKITEES